MEDIGKNVSRTQCDMVCIHLAQDSVRFNGRFLYVQ